MNLKSNIKKTNFLVIMMFFSSIFLGCKKNFESTNKHIKSEFSNQKIIDSLQLDLNKDGRKDKIEVVQNDKGEREIKVLLNTEKGFKEITRNNEIIGCSTCGNQSGDPYINLRASALGFDISLEDVVYSFNYKDGEVSLIQIDFLVLNQASEGIEEKHQIFTKKDFGIINLRDFTNDTVTALVSNLNKQIHEDKNIISTRNHKISLPVSLKGISILDYPTPEKYKNLKIDNNLPTSIVELSNNVLVLFFEGDTERWYLTTLKDSEIMDRLLIGKSETIETENGTIDNYIDFTIGKDYKINLEYSTGKNAELKKLEKKETYYVNPKNNKIVKSK